MTLLRQETRSDDRAAPTAESLVRYEDDAYTWALQQAALLRAGRLDTLDITNLADEIADVAGREYDKLESALVRVIQHLLRWDHQPERRTRSWVLSIKEHRRRASYQLGDHPGLKSILHQAIERAYQTGRSAALSETDLPDAAIPGSNPYSWDDIMNRDIVWPEQRV